VRFRAIQPAHAAYRAGNKTRRQPMKTTSTLAPNAGDWALRLATGQTIHVPGRISSMTTYVLLEQERWFEGEIGFVARLLEAGEDALDIGANHGVYTLALAGSAADGRVWAFEPTREPRARLERTVAANGLQARVCVVPCALSDRSGPAVFHTSAQSELNSMHAQGGAVEETVALDTLDAFAQRELTGRRVGFVKIDAEGEEPRVLQGGHHFFQTREPIVMFEMIAGTRPQLGLLDDFAALGYGIFRHLAELDLLVEYQPSGDPNDSWVLNLFAVKPAQQERLARQGLLLRWSDLDARSSDPAPHAEALSRLAGQASMQGLPTPTPEADGEDFCLALAHAARPSWAWPRARPTACTTCWPRATPSRPP
jgi:FkbM family methyltransferase